MKTDLRLEIGNWLLVVGSRLILPTLLKMTARLAETGEVRVVDCGNAFDIFIAGSGKIRSMDVLGRIKVSTAYNCHEVLATLEGMPATPEPFVILDLLRAFSGTGIWMEERKRVLNLCLGHMNRLNRCAGGLVSVHPPNVLCKTEIELLKIIQAGARETYRVEIAPPTFGVAERF